MSDLVLVTGGAGYIGVPLCEELVASGRRVRALEEQLLKDLEFHGIIGKSPAMLEVFDFARKVARHYSNVLLVGPTGSGKELVARAIHQISPVSQQRLAVCNCSALMLPVPPTTIPPSSSFVSTTSMRLIVVCRR